MSIMTVVCGVWALSVTLRIIHAGGVGKNGSTVAVSQQKQFNMQKQNTNRHTRNSIDYHTVYNYGLLFPKKIVLWIFQCNIVNEKWFFMITN